MSVEQLTVCWKFNFLCGFEGKVRVSQNICAVLWEQTMLWSPTDRWECGIWYVPVSVLCLYHFWNAILQSLSVELTVRSVCIGWIRLAAHDCTLQPQIHYVSKGIKMVIRGDIWSSCEWQRVLFACVSLLWWREAPCKCKDIVRASCSGDVGCAFSGERHAVMFRLFVVILSPSREMLMYGACGQCGYAVCLICDGPTGELTATQTLDHVQGSHVPYSIVYASRTKYPSTFQLTSSNIQCIYVAVCASLKQA